MLNAIADALLPPASFAALALLLVLAGRRWRWLLATVLVVLVALSLPVVSTLLLIGLAPGPDSGQLSASAPPQAIVILSAEGVRTETDQLEPGLFTLDRMRAGAALARRTGLPVLVSGGIIYAGTEPLAAMMARSMQDDFRIPARWVEGKSLDTWQNAAFSAAILREAGISRVYLVTHFWHMRRSIIAFRRAGLDVTAAPVRPPLLQFHWFDFTPRTIAWEESYIAFHEWVGLGFYALRR